MSQHHYNFTAGSSHADNDMLAPIVPEFDAPPSSPFVYVHSPGQVGEHQGCLFRFVLMFSLVDKEGRGVFAFGDSSLEQRLSIHSHHHGQGKGLYSEWLKRSLGRPLV
jgi:hypothetical protein